MKKFFLLLCMMLTAAAISEMLGPSKVCAVTVGVLPRTRVNYDGAVFTTGDYSILRGELSQRGDVVVEISTLSAASLAVVDIFYTSCLNRWGPGSLDAAEQTAITDWVSNGGILFVAGEIAYFQGAYNTWLNPFGISENGEDLDIVTGVIIAPTDFIVNGPNGIVTELKLETTGYFDAGGYTTIATQNDMPVLIKKQFGSGLVIAVGDHSMFTDLFIGPNEEALFLNILDTRNSCECDLNTDGRCDMQDWLLFGGDWGRTDCGTPPGSGNPPNDCECDFNQDGRCDMQDWLKFGQDWGRTDCP